MRVYEHVQHFVRPIPSMNVYILINNDDCLQRSKKWVLIQCVRVIFCELMRKQYWPVSPWVSWSCFQRAGRAHVLIILQFRVLLCLQSLLTYIYIYTCAWIHAFSSYVFLAFNGIYTQELKKLHIIPLLVARMLETCVERGRLSMTGDEEEAQLRRKRWERLRDGATHRSQTLASKQTHKACPLLVPAFVDSVVPLFHFNVLGSVLDVSNPWNETLIWSVDQLQIITHFMTWSSRYVRRNAIIFFCKCTIHRKLLINHNEKNSSMSKVKI